MAKISVRKAGPEDYEVTVEDQGGHSSHTVRITEKDRVRYGGAVDSETLLEASFQFLLEREPKEAILSRFELPVIGRYFPEFESTIRKRLA